MAFRRNYGRGKGRVPARALARKANKRRTWATINLSQKPDCLLHTLDWTYDETRDPICSDAASLQIFPNLALEQIFNDAAGIKRIVGKMHVRPFFDFQGMSPSEINTAYQQFNAIMYVGMRRYESTSENVDGPFLSPLGNLIDYSDAHWIDTWEHMWWPSQELQSTIIPEGAVLGVCSNVSGGAGFIQNGITWAATEGAIDTEIETDCSVVRADVNEPGQTTYIGRFPAAYTFNMDKRFKKPLALRENQGLQLWCQYGPITGNGPGSWNASQWDGIFLGMEYSFNLKMQIEF